MFSVFILFFLFVSWNNTERKPDEMKRAMVEDVKDWNLVPESSWVSHSPLHGMKKLYYVNAEVSANSKVL